MATEKDVILTGTLDELLTEGFVHLTERNFPDKSGDSYYLKTKEEFTEQLKTLKEKYNGIGKVFFYHVDYVSPYSSEVFISLTSAYVHVKPTPQEILEASKHILK